MTDPSELRAGEVVVLRGPGGASVLLVLAPGPTEVPGRGVVDLTPHVGGPPGTTFEWAGAKYQLDRPTLSDLLANLRRRAQIVTPKDAMFLLYLAGVGPGTRVAEAGSGSGALTTVLAFAVGPEGSVDSFDRRDDFLEVARQNVAAAGLAPRVRFARRDVAAEGLPPGPYDAVVLDVPAPWEVVPRVAASTRPGARVATYTPTYNQLERTVRSLRENGYQDVQSVELIERELHVGEGGTRPAFDMLGHTGFLT
ncbi:MAG TPA: methyltransferase domain-containing protein, partial [Thermoplasmata archaeon]|nr:methyltransferase domain-containing protein [Thermoplasmata archaeon]